MVLETDTRQPEAMALYATAGYAPIAPFGAYRCEPGNRCYAKAIGVDARASRVAPTRE